MTLLLASFDWSIIWDNRGALAHGLRLTIEVSVIGIVCATLIGILLGAARAQRVPVVSQVAAVYVEVIRNTPILVQIFMWFFAFPELTGHNFEPFTAAIFAVSIWGGAFNTENFRAGFEAVPKRFKEAGQALGFGRVGTFFNVTLPIGGRIALPSTINTHISVLKNTSLMTAIGFGEFTSVTRSISANTFRDTEMLTLVAVTYLVLVWSLSWLIRLLERRLALPEDVR